jgi:hypothetical protein
VACLPLVRALPSQPFPVLLIGGCHINLYILGKHRHVFNGAFQYQDVPVNAGRSIRHRPR